MTGRTPVKITSSALLVAAVAGLAWYGSEHLADQAPHTPVAAAADAVAPDPTIRQGLLRSRELPVEQYLVSFKDATAERAAVLRNVQACMARYGLTYDPPVRPESYTAISDNTANLERRYGLSDRATAEKWGYAWPSAQGEPPRWDPTSAQMDALYGKNGDGEVLGSIGGVPVPKGGCNAEAREKAGAQDDSAAREIGSDSFTRAMKDPAVQQGFDAWSACMKTKGYAYKNPFEITQGPKADDWATSPETKKIAVAEVDCKQSTGLLDVWFATEAKLQEKGIAAKKTRLDAARQHNRSVVRRSLAALK
ncbi:hypothetical protein J7W19_19860 [Streptomyces mobaraensis NBRC 13819 = DSM 40847]|uniref:Uncharacterized protein n=2 Tax=Streptomyces mobaraensis TaxID=35621 RepID=A0A5N5WH12_STRMB|nr:hypothetical protein [Streptomyces mobaraensis]EMF00024.1 hypothetical protein H340_13641 [Streptomyces mobaraensis NBRC 13819 = DSM 40847]KAB7852824.1 hypothetical protein FRZ00_01055 [Streptomyces mobaraensis]QTT75330.1 hypothetical protein J7W19_19860 [Streptomyces mobaraensis NBRC 13819 = DSM 40847]